MILLFGTDNCSQHAALAQGLKDAGEQLSVAPISALESMSETRHAIAESRAKCIVVEPPINRIAEAENDVERAFRVNCENLLNVGVSALEFGCKVVVLSTSEVFGQRGGPWIESDEPQPKSTLAESVLRAEKLFLRMKTNVLVVRTGVRLGKVFEDFESLSEAPKNAGICPILSEDLGRILHSFIERDVKGIVHVPSVESPIKIRDFLQEVSPNVQGIPTRQTKYTNLFATHAVLDSVKVNEYEKSLISSWRTALPTLSPKVVVSSPQETNMSVVTTARRVDKPWGHEIIWAQTEKYVGKILFVKAGERLSLQYHEVKDETIYVLSGKMVFEVGERDKERDDLIMKAGDSYRIRPHTVHRMIAVEDTQILEASTPELNDVVRLEDSYGRAGTSAP